MSNYTKGYEDGVRATKAEYLKLLKEENLHPVKELTDEEYEALEYLIEEFGKVRFMEGNTGMNLSEMSDEILERFRAILRKAQE